VFPAPGYALVKWMDIVMSVTPKAVVIIASKAMRRVVTKMRAGLFAIGC